MRSTVLLAAAVAVVLLADGVFGVGAPIFETGARHKFREMMRESRGEAARAAAPPPPPTASPQAPSAATIQHGLLVHMEPLPDLPRDADRPMLFQQRAADPLPPVDTLQVEHGNHAVPEGSTLREIHDDPRALVRHLDDKLYQPWNGFKVPKEAAGGDKHRMFDEGASRQLVLDNELLKIKHDADAELKAATDKMNGVVTGGDKGKEGHGGEHGDDGHADGHGDDHGDGHADGHADDHEHGDEHGDGHADGHAGDHGHGDDHHDGSTAVEGGQKVGAANGVGDGAGSDKQQKNSTVGNKGPPAIAVHTKYGTVKMDAPANPANEAEPSPVVSRSHIGNPFEEGWRSFLTAMSSATKITDMTAVLGAAIAGVLVQRIAGL